MSSIKVALKAAKSALDAQNYGAATEEARKAIALDARSYHAQVFLGLALEKQNQYDASEIAYKTATSIKEKDLLAWQGLVSLYEKQAGQKLDDYHDAALRVAELHMEADDRIKCQTVIDTYTDNAKKYGTKAQYKHSLEILLPNSSIYGFLEGRIPQPASTYVKIIELVEAEEKAKINTEIGQRRTRLGAKIDRVTAEVRREIFEKSPLETLYSEVINWTHEDEVRREYEKKLLSRASETLAILPAALKTAKRQQVQKLAEGVVILKHPFLLAWKIHLEWQDVDEIENLDLSVIRDFIALFPHDGLAKVASGFLESDASPFPNPTEESKTSKENRAEKDDENDLEPLSVEDRLVLMADGMIDSPSSILAHRFMGQYYVFLDEYESLVKIAREGLRCISSESDICGLSFNGSMDAMKTMLASGLVHYQAPRHHPEARSLFEDILSRKSTATSALLGIGLIYEEQENYLEAIKYLDQALRGNSDPKIRSEAAWCKALNGDYEMARKELEACLSDLEDSDNGTRSLQSSILYRIGICLWYIDISTKARRDRNGAYARFLASLQLDINLAPAYTSLGVYYADYAKDKKRARKCFQKAFELSALETEAAVRLANSFARSKEWDLVEVVAQRVVDSGRTKPAPGSKRKGISWPHAALGVVQLNNQEYPKSIVSFQTALRISPDDYHCWVGLGESYHNSGRYIAATKAFEHTEHLQLNVQDNEDERWFSRYMLANVKRELGEYDAAIKGYREVSATRPTEYGILIALLQCLVEAAFRGLDLGFFGRAAERAGEAIILGKDIVSLREDAFNLWKGIGDACSIYSLAQGHASKLPVPDLRSLLERNTDQQMYSLLGDIDGVDETPLLESGDTTTLGFVTLSLHAAILAHKRAIYVCANDIHARAVAWYNLGWTEYRAHACGIVKLPKNTKKKPLRYVKASVQCFKKAIELEAGNAEFWNSLGIATHTLNPKVSQHSFIRSLYLNEKNARVWTNLGALYLVNNDTQLANEAFTRAQSTDPDHAQAWLGQGLIAEKTSDQKEARNLFSHAFEIANSSSTIINEKFAQSTFDNLPSSSPSTYTSDILHSLFALHQLLASAPSNLTHQHLSALFLERASSHPTNIPTLQTICTSLETAYESTESPTTLLHYALAQADLARAHLASHNYPPAIDAAETALSLTADIPPNNPTRHRLRLSAHITAALAHHHSPSSSEKASSIFTTALRESSPTTTITTDPALATLAALTLYASHRPSSTTSAQDALLDIVETHAASSDPPLVDAPIILGAIAALDGDTETLEAVVADLESLRVSDKVDVRDRDRVQELLEGVAGILAGGEGVAERVKEGVVLAPWRGRGWVRLAELEGSAGEVGERGSGVAEAGVVAAVREGEGRAGVVGIKAEEMCRAFAGTGRVGDAQKGVMVAPWVAEGWVTFAGEGGVGGGSG